MSDIENITIFSNDQVSGYESRDVAYESQFELDVYCD